MLHQVAQVSLTLVILPQSPGVHHQALLNNVIIKCYDVIYRENESYHMYSFITCHFPETLF